MSITHPSHWRSYIDPSHWFRIWHPPGWTLVETGGEASLVAPETGGVLRIVGRWRSNWRKVDFDTVIDPDQVFPSSRRVRRVKPLDVPYPSMSVEGDSNDAARLPWWKRLAAAPLVAAVEAVDGPIQIGLRGRDVSDLRPPRPGARNAGDDDHELAGVRRRAGRPAPHLCRPRRAHRPRPLPLAQVPSQR